MAQGDFVTAVNCMDGRVQEPVLRWMTRRLSADFVDMITEPGPDAMLAAGDAPELPSIERRVRISVEKHGSRVVAIVGHTDCAGNPVADETHLEQVRRSVELLESWKLGARILGLWVDPRWTVNVTYDSEGTLA